MPAISFTPFPVLLTERLLLRELNWNDAHDIFLLRSNDAVNKYLNRPKAKTIEDAIDFIKKINFVVRANQSIFWAICLQHEVHLSGTICLWNFSDEENKAEVGYELLPQFQGKGIIQEALVKVIEYAFKNLRLHTIEAWTTAHNTKSVRVLERNGFERDFAAEAKIDRAIEGEETIIYSLQNV